MTGPRLFTRPFVTLMIGHALQSLGFSSLLLMPLFLDHLGATRTQVGVVLATAAVGGLLVRPLVGWALDTLGRIPTLAVGTAFLSTGLALAGVADDLGPVVYLAHVCTGIGTGSLFTGYFTLAADLVPPSRRTEGLALFGISGLLALIVNPVAGALGVDGASLPRFYLVMAGLVGSSGLLLFALPSASPSSPPPNLSLRDVVEALRSRPLWSVWWATLVFSTLVAVFMAFVTVVAADRGVASPSIVWLTYAIGAVTVRAFGARLPERVGPSNLVVPSLLVYVVGLGGAAMATTGPGFAAAGLLCGIGHGFAFPVLTGQVVTRIAGTLRGSAMALFTALWDLTKLGLVPVAGWMADGLGDQAMLLVAGALGTLSLTVWWRLEAGLPPSSADHRSAA